MTNLPKVNVTRTEGGGYLIVCSHCPNYRLIKLNQRSANVEAVIHRGTHAQPDPDDAA